MTTQIQRFAEFVPPALLSIQREATARGMGYSGSLGNDTHTFGAHLSLNRLVATGKQNDYTLHPPPLPGFERAAAAIDLGAGPAWAGEWLEEVRARCKSGKITFLGELIGDPDLVPGLGRDARIARYAAPPSWDWVPYSGTGHVAWCHLWVRRNRLADGSIGAALFQGWGTTGRIGASLSDADIAAQLLTTGSRTRRAVESIVENMQFPIPNHTYRTLGTILPALSALADRMAGANREAFKKEVVAAVLEELRKSTP